MRQTIFVFHNAKCVSIPASSIVITKGMCLHLLEGICVEIGIYGEAVLGATPTIKLENLEDINGLQYLLTEGQRIRPLTNDLDHLVNACGEHMRLLKASASEKTMTDQLANFEDVATATQVGLDGLRDYLDKEKPGGLGEPVKDSCFAVAAKLVERAKEWVNGDIPTEDTEAQVKLHTSMTSCASRLLTMSGKSIKDGEGEKVAAASKVINPSINIMNGIVKYTSLGDSAAARIEKDSTRANLIVLCRELRKAEEALKNYRKQAKPE